MEVVCTGSLIPISRIWGKTLAQAEVNRGGHARGADGDDPPDHRGTGASHHAYPDNPGRGCGGAEEVRSSGQHGLPEQLDGKLPELEPRELCLVL